MKPIFERLYDSDINCSVSSFCWCGFDVKLGDEMNGFTAQTTVLTWAEVEPWLEAQALVHFPNSVFALSTENNKD